MKKLKTWQIVLLVIFYPVGICVWIYRAILREIEEDGELDNFSYDTYDYDGNTAVGVYYNGEQIGNIAQTDLKKFLSRTVCELADFEVVSGESRRGIWVGFYFNK